MALAKEVRSNEQCGEYDFNFTCVTQTQASSSQPQGGQQGDQQELRIAWQYKKYIDSNSQGSIQAETGASRRPSSSSGACDSCGAVFVCYYSVHSRLKHTYASTHTHSHTCTCIFNACLCLHVHQGHRKLLPLGEQWMLM